VNRARLFVVLGLVYIDMLGIGIAFPLLPKLVQQFEHGNTSHASYVVGFLASAFSLMQFFCAPAIGAASDAYGRRPVILLALAGSVVSYTAMGLAPNLIVLAIGRLVAGAMGGSFSTAGAYLADITPPEKRAQSFGLIGSAFGVGFITGPALGGILGAFDLRLPFLFAAGLCALNFAVGFFVLRESLDEAHRKPFHISRAHPIGALREIGRYGQVKMLIAIFIMAMFANRVAEITWVLYTGYRFHWGAFLNGLSLAMVGVMFIVGQGVMPRVLIPRIGEPRAVLLGLSVSIVLLILYGTVTVGWMMFLVMPLGIFGWTLAQPAMQALMSKSVPANEQGLLQGALASLMNLTSIFGPPIWAGLFGFFISPAAPVIIPGAAFFAAATVFALALTLAVRWVGGASSAAAETATS
jgi:DHA1 family tetracycline resistance protein-like MFS transporter